MPTIVTSPFVIGLAAALACPLASQKPGADDADGRIQKLVAALEALEIDARRDSMAELLRKRARARSEIDAFTTVMLNEMSRAEHIGCDVVRFVAETAPRLTGRIVKIGTDGDAATVELGAIQPGDLVLLLPGEHVLPSRQAWRDVAFVGTDPTEVVLTGSVDSASRVRFQNLRIDCRDDDFLDLRDGGAVQMRGCALYNFNSGAGGSNAVFSSGGTFLFDDCLFDGTDGRAKGAGSGGDALDLRGSFASYCRNTLFVGTEEIVRVNGFCTFESCRSENDVGSGITRFPDGILFLRDNRAKLRDGEDGATVEFALATDAAEFVAHVVEPRRGIDAHGEATASALALRQDLRYWATLVRHVDPEVRQTALGRLGSLLRRAMPKIRLDAASAERLPEKMRSTFLDELRSARLLDWIDEHREKLEWNERGRFYRLR